ncbi:MAG: hypothetical protein HYV63_05030 [Candidatus Schekmanbacteria bacterium]|nr:hypothetical protein [Candidatus Schekmanbacteria bacterium]
MSVNTLTASRTRAVRPRASERRRGGKRRLALVSCLLIAAALTFMAPPRPHDAGGGAAVAVAQETADPAPTAAAPPASAAAVPGTGDAAALGTETLKQMRLGIDTDRKRLDERSQALDERERQLLLRADEVEKEVKRLTALRNEILDAIAKRKVEESEELKRMLEVYRKMKPSNVAKALLDLYERDEAFALSLFERLATRNLAKIMEIIVTTKPETAARLTEQLARPDLTSAESDLKERVDAGMDEAAEAGD